MTKHKNASYKVGSVINVGYEVFAIVLDISNDGKNFYLVFSNGIKDWFTKSSIYNGRFKREARWLEAVNYDDEGYKYVIKKYSRNRCVCVKSKGFYSEEVDIPLYEFIYMNKMPFKVGDVIKLKGVPLVVLNYLIGEKILIIDVLYEKFKTTSRIRTRLEYFHGKTQNIRINLCNKIELFGNNKSAIHTSDDFVLYNEKVYSLKEWLDMTPNYNYCGDFKLNNIFQVYRDIDYYISVIDCNKKVKDKVLLDIGDVIYYIEEWFSGYLKLVEYSKDSSKYIFRKEYKGDINSSSGELKTLKISDVRDYLNIF